MIKTVRIVSVLFFLSLLDRHKPKELKDGIIFMTAINEWSLNEGLHFIFELLSLGAQLEENEERIADDILALLYTHNSFTPRFSVLKSGCQLSSSWTLVSLKSFSNNSISLHSPLSINMSGSLHFFLQHFHSGHHPHSQPASNTPQVHHFIPFLVKLSFKCGCHHYFPTRTQFPLSHTTLSLLIFLSCSLKLNPPLEIA